MLHDDLQGELLRDTLIEPVRALSIAVNREKGYKNQQGLSSNITNSETQFNI